MDVLTEIAHAERAHALLSASGAHRWLHCPPSARLEATLPDTESGAAKRGTLAHEIAELKLRKHFVEPIGPQKFAAAMRKFKSNPLYEPDMEANTNAYLEYVQGVVHGFSAAPYIAIERKLDLSHIVPESFGTGDCIVIGSGKLHIIDYKNGQGVPVPAENNPQMKLYALGALRAYSLLYHIDDIHLSIVQPKVWDEPSTWSLSVADLLAWGESIKPIAQQAFDGEGDYSPGEHCGFCRAKTTCRARVEGLLSVEAKAPLKPPLISWDEVADILRRGDGLVKWYNGLKESALTHVLAGGDLPGFKAVAGRGGRDFADLDKAFAHLQASGIDEALLWERKPITAAQSEKLFENKKKYKEVLEDTGHVVKRDGAPTLAAADDPRPSVSKMSAEQVFGNG